ncbi:suppressor of fused domain protein [Actinoplanes sp. NPDC051513]|uniref:suppressor of fused domain protein n=1 Tax=Actinoplanes sp. NPDC051513 TaxID=3363908 RepID=UPI0037B88463
MDRTQQANRAVAAWAAEVIGGQPTARGCRGEKAGQQVSIARFTDRPQKGVTTYATLGLSDTRVPRQVEPPLGTEILGVCDSVATDFPQILGVIAYRAQIDGRSCEPDEIFDNVVPPGLSATLRHAILIPQFLWDDDAFAVRVIDYKTVVWLLAVPITDAERQYAFDRGPDELQTVFEEVQIDIFDPQRPSAV